MDFILNNSVFFSALILFVAYIFIATEKIPKVTVALLGASVTVIVGLLSQVKYNGENINPLYFINFIDFNVIFLLVSMMIIVSITAKSGIFNYLAEKLLKLTSDRPILILITLGLFTAFLSAFLDNVTTVILVMPITFSIAKRLNITPIPFLLCEIMSSNIGGVATLIGDPPNIIIGSIGNLSFLDFIKELTGIACLILVCTIIFLVLCFRKSLQIAKDKTCNNLNIEATGKIVDFKLMVRSVSVLLFVILGFILHDVIHIQVSIIAMFGASILLLFEKPSDILKEVEWNTILFFVGLFIIIGALEASGGIKLMAEWILKITQGSQTFACMLILWASGIISGVIDNIPYAATMAPMLLEIQKSTSAPYAYPLWWALSLGACLGGNMTIIGAAANVIVSENSAKHNHPISFLYFMKYGVVVVFISLVLSSLYLYFKFLK